MIDQVAPAREPAARGAPGPAPHDVATVGIVVTTYNHARFLEEALASVVAQRVRANDVVVVDDGSTDDPGSIVARFPDARLIRQPNRGLAAARNAGLKALTTSQVIFLDADDRLQPIAVEAGLACFARAPRSGLRVRRSPLSERPRRRDRRPVRASRRLRVSIAAAWKLHSHARCRHVPARVPGGDWGLRRALGSLRRLRRVLADGGVYPITGYPEFVADYRLHGANMSANHWAMLQSALAVQARHEPSSTADRLDRNAWIEGRRRWRRCYAEEMAVARYRERQQGATLAKTLPTLVRIVTASPTVAFAELVGGLRRRLAAVLPARHRTQLLSGGYAVPRLGRVRFGDLRRTTPISRCFGFDRGLPIDRHYIERFLKRNAAAIGGRVLEIGDDAYTRRFGADRVSSVDILHVHGGNPRATIVGDLADARMLPPNAYDCIVLTQTLQLVYDVRAAVSSVFTERWRQEAWCS